MLLGEYRKGSEGIFGTDKRGEGGGVGGGVVEIGERDIGCGDDLYIFFLGVVDVVDVVDVDVRCEVGGLG